MNTTWNIPCRKTFEGEDDSSPPYANTAVLMMLSSPWNVTRVMYSCATSTNSRKKKRNQAEVRARRTTASSQRAWATLSMLWSNTRTHCGADHSSGGPSNASAADAGGACSQSPYTARPSFEFGIQPTCALLGLRTHVVLAAASCKVLLADRARCPTPCGPDLNSLSNPYKTCRRFLQYMLMRHAVLLVHAVHLR